MTKTPKKYCEFYKTSIYNSLKTYHKFDYDNTNATTGKVSFVDDNSEKVDNRDLANWSIGSEISANLDSSAPEGIWYPVLYGRGSDLTYVPIFDNSAPVVSGASEKTFTDSECNEYVEFTPPPQYTLGIPSFLKISNVKNNHFRELQLKLPNVNPAELHVDWYLADPVAQNIYPQTGVLFWYKKIGNASTEFSKIKPGTIFSLDKNIQDPDQKVNIAANTKFLKLDNHRIQLSVNKKTADIPTLLGTNKEHYEFIPPARSSFIGSEPHDLEGIKLYKNVIFDIRNIYAEPVIDHQDNRKLTRYEEIKDYWEEIKVTDHTEDYAIRKGDAKFDIHIPDADSFLFFYGDDYARMGNGKDYLRTYIPEEVEESFRQLYKNLSNLVSVKSKKRSENLKRFCAMLATGPVLYGETIVFRGNYYYDNNGERTKYDWRLDLSDYLNKTYSEDSAFDANVFADDFKQISYSMYQEIQNKAGSQAVSSSMMIKKQPYIQYIYEKLAKKNDMYLMIPRDSSRTITVDKQLIGPNVSGPNVKVDLNFIPYGLKSQEADAVEGKTTKSNTYNQWIKAGPLEFATKMEGSETSQGYPAVYYRDLKSGGSIENILDGYAAQSENLRRRVGGEVNKEPNTLFFMHPNIKSIGFYKQGAIRINNSNCYIEEATVRQASIDNGKLDTKPVFIPDVNWFQHDVTESDTEHDKVSFNFDCGSSNYIKLYGIDIEWYRYDSEDLCSCDSFYEEVLNFTKKYTGDQGFGVPFYPDVPQDVPRGIGFGRVGYCNNLYIGKKGSNVSGGGEFLDLNYTVLPGVNNKYSPPIKSYGGYDDAIIANIGITMPQHPLPQKPLPILGSRNEQYDENTKCYMRSGVSNDENLDVGNYSQAGISNGKKGIFHPYLGWLSINTINEHFSELKNKTFVDSKKIKLKGVGFLFSPDRNSEREGYYSSRIMVEFTGDARDGEFYQFGTGRASYSYLMNNLSNDMMTETCIPNEVCPIYDFGVERRLSYSERAAERNCISLNDVGMGFIDDSSYTEGKDEYNPAVRYSIPANSILKKKISDNGNIADSEIKIQDISVRLNFLNYVNPEDLKITLVTNLTSRFTESDSIFWTDEGLKNYTTKLEENNPANKIVLFNRQHIENFEKDFCITFSDNAPKHNVLSKSNELIENVGYDSWKLNTIRSHDAVRPTIKTGNINDSEHYVYKNIFLNNGFEPTCNKFAKWRGSPLNGAYFKLQIEIFNNYEDKNYSSYIIPPSLNEEFDGKFKSSSYNNNLCNFEIIIDTNEDIDNINHPITEHIDYKKSFRHYLGENIQEKSGYNYIINFSDDGKALLPPINSHAPFNSITNHNTCKFPNEGLNTLSFLRMPPLSNALVATGIGLAFFSFALSNINMTNAIGMGALVATIGAASIGAGANMILAAFSNARRERSQNAYDESFFKEDYTKRDGFGQADKVLVDISTDGAAWYTFDADIFKFDELSSPIYKPKIMGYRVEDNNFETRDNEQILAMPNEGLYGVFKGHLVQKKDLNHRNADISIDDTAEFLVDQNKENTLPIINWDNQQNNSKEPFYINFLNYNDYQINNKFYLDPVDPNTENYFWIKTDATAFTFLQSQLSTETNVQLVLFNKPDFKKDNILKDIGRNIVDVHEIFSIPDFTSNEYNTYIGVSFVDSELEPKKYLYKDFNFTFYSSSATSKDIILYPYQFKDIKNLKLSKIGQQTSFPVKGHMAAYGEGSWGTGTAFNYEYGNSLTIPLDADIEDISDKTRSDSGGLVFKNKGKFNTTSLDKKIQSISYTNHNKGFPNRDGKNTDHFMFHESEGSEITEDGDYISENVKVRSTDNKIYNSIATGITEEVSEKIDTTYSDKKYWINIDGDQKGYLTRQNTVKILKKIEYSCYEINNDQGLNCINVCGDDPYGKGARGPNNPPISSEAAETESLEQETKISLFNTVAPISSFGDPSITFTNSDEAIEAQKALYPDATWREEIIQKSNLRLSCGNTNVDTILRVRETYDIAVGINGTGLTSAKDILENNDNIKIRFVHWPRKLKNLDLQFDAYILQTDGLAYKGRNKYTDGMNIKNYFYSWICGTTNEDKSQELETTVPPYYKLTNEMVFRAFYGSTDKMEFKTDGLDTKDDFEWIPYEYDKSIQCSASAVRPENLITLFTRGFMNPAKAGLYLRCKLYSGLLSLGLPGAPVDNSGNRNIINHKCARYVDQNDKATLLANTSGFPGKDRVSELENDAAEYLQILEDRGSVPENHYTQASVNQILTIINNFY